MKDPVARSWLLDRVVTPQLLGRDLAGPTRDHLESLDPPTMASHLIGGLTIGEMPPGRAQGLAAEVGGPNAFVLPPLPNHMFTRDTSCWIYGGVSLNPMALTPRRRETANLEAVYRFHPRFSAEAFMRWFGGVEEEPGHRDDRGR